MVQPLFAKAHKEWSIADDYRLVKNWNNEDYQIAADLGRTTAAIITRKSLLRNDAGKMAQLKQTFPKADEVKTLIKEFKPQKKTYSMKKRSAQVQMNLNDFIIPEVIVQKYNLDKPGYMGKGFTDREKIFMLNCKDLRTQDIQTAFPGREITTMVNRCRKYAQDPNHYFVGILNEIKAYKTSHLPEQEKELFQTLEETILQSQISPEFEQKLKESGFYKNHLEEPIMEHSFNEVKLEPLPADFFKNPDITVPVQEEKPLSIQSSISISFSGMEIDMENKKIIFKLN